MVNWRAVLYGIVTSFVIGLISGLGIPFTNATLPAVGAGLTGLVAGGVAGYVAGGSLGNGGLHGLLATALGSVAVGIVLLVVGTLAAGIFGFGAAVAFLFWVVVASVPGIVGGAIGAVIAPEESRVGQPAA